MKTKIQNLIALLFYYLGKKPRCSTLIDEVTITLGYGKLDNIGWFQYPLPPRIIYKHFDECLTWPDFLEKRRPYWRERMMENKL